MDTNSRYQHNPLLRLLECYVLLAIEQLDEHSMATLDAMRPKLAKTYRREGTWDQILAGALELPEDFPEKVREVWQRNQAIAVDHGTTLSPQEFAELFVDANFFKR